MLASTKICDTHVHNIEGRKAVIQTFDSTEGQSKRIIPNRMTVQVRKKLQQMFYRYRR